MGDEASRYIPTSIKRTVRQRCRFGCVMCGAPVFDYEHIIDYATVKEHAVDNITLLCPNHHREKTSGRLPRDIIRKADANPHNGQREFTSAHGLFFTGSDVRFNIGSNIFGTNIENVSSFAAIEMGGDTLAGFKREDDALLLNIVVRDAVLNPIIIVEDGELVISTGVKDVTMIGRDLVLRPAFSIKPIRMTFGDCDVSIDSGFFYGWGRTLEVTRDGVIMGPGNNRIAHCTFMDCTIGLQC